MKSSANIFPVHCNVDIARDDYIQKHFTNYFHQFTKIDLHASADMPNIQEIVQLI